LIVSSWLPSSLSAISNHHHCLKKGQIGANKVTRFIHVWRVASRGNYPYFCFQLSELLQVIQMITCSLVLSYLLLLFLSVLLFAYIFMDKIGIAHQQVQFVAF
jgi:hypothetical protein